MKPPRLLPVWTIASPVLCWVLLAGALAGLQGPAYAGVLGVGLLAGVFSAVHHAEVVAHRIGEPFGTLVLALAVTVIEVALIVALMVAGGPATNALARDTVYAAIMIIVNGLLGACLLLGGIRFGEQKFELSGASASLATLSAITALTLVLPNFTTTVAGPVYSGAQLSFVAAVSLILYGTFLLVQTVRHRDYFLPPNPADIQTHSPPPAARVAAIGAALLVLCLVAVVLLAKALAPTIESAVDALGAPKAVVGIVISFVVLMPEGLASLQAARRNRLQTSLNLTLGSALASIGLTIPAVALFSLVTGRTIILGLDEKETLLLALSLFVASLSLNTGRTTVLQGTVHLVIFAVYLFTAVVP